MFFAPEPAPEQRKRFLTRTLQALGLGALSSALVLAALVAFLASQWLASNPQKLYHHTWQTLPYLIYDPNKLGDWQQWEHKFDSQIKSDDDAVRFANEMIGSLNDPFTHLHSKEEVAAIMQQMSGHFAGVGVSFGVRVDGDGKPVLVDGEPQPTTDADGNPVIEKVIPGGPAEKVGLKDGDVVVTADGAALKGKNLKELVKQLKGEAGSTVSLKVRSNGVERQVDIIRDTVTVPVVSSKQFGDIGYIRLDNFEQEDAPAQMIAALNKLSDAKSIILDLRSNPGGRVDICINLVGLFLDEGDVVKIRNRVPFGGYTTTTYHLSKNALVVSELDETSGLTRVKRGKRLPHLAAGKSIVILVNGHSASAAEMFTGALKDNHRVVVVGERTFGKGIGQMMVPMPNGTMLRVTSLHYFTPSGAWLGDGSSEHDGIKPDHDVTNPEHFKVLTDKDRQFNFALEFLRKRLDGK